MIPQNLSLIYISSPLNINGNTKVCAIKRNRIRTVIPSIQAWIINQYLAFDDRVNYKEIYDRHRQSQRKSLKRKLTKLNENSNGNESGVRKSKKRKITAANANVWSENQTQKGMDINELKRNHLLMAKHVQNQEKMTVFNGGNATHCHL